jgi:phospholipid-transporting ATPase
VWILTGDKIEIAINIAYSCKLLDNKLRKIIVDLDEENELHTFLCE